MSDERELRKGSTQTLILAVLTAGPLHGYAITREIKRRSADALEIGEGSLYPILRAMEREELVSSAWDVQESGPARRVYSLTEKGKTALARQEATWRQFTSAVNLVLDSAGTTEAAK